MKSIRGAIDDDVRIREYFKRVVEKNTYFFHSEKFEKISEAHIAVLKNLLLQLNDTINTQGLTVKTVSDWITTDRMGLQAVLTLNGISRETFLRLISFIRIINDPDINLLVNKEAWPEESNEFREWDENKLTNLILNNESFREGIVKLFFYGATKESISKNLPLFEYYKLSKEKFEFSTKELIDTIVRYKYKGSYAADMKNNPENLITEILNEKKIPYHQGKLPRIDRMMDFIIPNRKNPKIIIESSYVVTTSSGLGDKAKTEQGVAKSIKNNYPNALFVGFVDGIGWLVRTGDLQRIVSSFDEVFTFRPEELKRFEQFVETTIRGN